MKKYLLEITVFLCGAVLMALEMIGSKILAPYVGTAMPIWASLIGVILFSMSAGYWYGGKAADRRPEYRFLGFIIIASGLYAFVMLIIRNNLLELLQSFNLEIRSIAILAALILFAVPAFFLGMVSPFAIKLKLDDLKMSGRSAGNLYAISTFGSIIGTFSAGFYLITFLTISQIIFLLASLLVINGSVILFFKHPKLGKFLIIFFLLFVITGGFVVNIPSGREIIETQYNHIEVVQAGGGKTGLRPVRIMKTNDTYSSAIYLGSDAEDLVFDYVKCYRMDSLLVKNIKKSLMIGGGGYTYPMAFLDRFPEAKIDVVEIDPGTTKVARDFFGLKDNSRMRIFHQDGRIFINRTNEKYDVIYGDAFKARSIPANLSSKEAMEQLSRILNDEGVLLINIIGSVKGEDGKMFRAEYRTLKSVFRHVDVVMVNSEYPRQVQNLMLVAYKVDKSVDWKAVLDKSVCSGTKWAGDIDNDQPVLTDDFNPIESFMGKNLYEN